MKLKPIKEQVVVLLGASSGIGRVTAKRFAAKGARVVVAARSHEGLEDVVAEITNAGGEAVMQVTDTIDPAAVQALADFAVKAYGRIDTWVQLAGVGVSSEWQDITVEEFRKVLDINIVGQFNALKAAVPELRKQGGAYIGLGSVESTVAFPLQAAYAAAKHGVAGLLDAVRLELMHEQVPVTVTNVRPAAIDTPFFERAKAKLGVQPAAPPPVYQPEDVARAILYAAENGPRDLFVGGGGRLFSALNMIAPGVMDKVISATQWNVQKTDRPKSPSDPNGLDGAAGELDRERGDWHGRPSVYTWIRTNPKTTFALAAAAVGATAAIVHEIAESQRARQTTATGLRDRLDEAAQRAKPYARHANDAWERLLTTARDQISSWR